MQTTHGRPRASNAPETIQRGRVVGFRQAAMVKRGGAISSSIPFAPAGRGPRIHGRQPLARKGGR